MKILALLATETTEEFVQGWPIGSRLVDDATPCPPTWIECSSAELEARCAQLSAAQALLTEWATLRAERNRRLSECDWRVLPDAPGGQRDAWVTYRAALRDLPQGYQTPADVVWPTPPE